MRTCACVTARDCGRSEHGARRNVAQWRVDYMLLILDFLQLFGLIYTIATEQAAFAPACVHGAPQRRSRAQLVRRSVLDGRRQRGRVANRRAEDRAAVRRRGIAFIADSD